MGANEALSRVLDSEENGVDHDRDGADGSVQDLLAQVQSLAEEKQRAEAEAEQRASMLRVHQVQLVERAQERAAAAQALVTAAQEAAGWAEGDAKLRLTELLRQLEEHAAEAQLFAAQQEREVAVTQHSRGPAGGRALAGAADSDAALDDVAGVAPARRAGDADLEEELMEAMGAGQSFSERAKWIPLRLNLDERRLLRLLEGALAVSEYTDKVDISTWKSKTGRIHTQIKYLCAILCGLVVAENYAEGQRLIKDRDFVTNAEFFQNCFEIGRRCKVMNPGSMRSDYGKLLYMLMDSSDPYVRELLEFDCVKPLRTVYRFLEERGALQMLEDPLMHVATAEVVAGERDRSEIQAEIKRKEKARAALAHKYKTRQVSEDELLHCIYSISDNNSYLFFNRDPIDKAITYLTTFFSPTAIDGPYSLAIQSGRGGARLTHNHERQYHYVLQSLALWREVSTEMFKLWVLAETDLLDPRNGYRLIDTGQGLNRVQQAPETLRAMTRIVTRCQQRLGHWVGSSVVHMGDHNVPNALLFIDKYTQVPRILNPVVLVLDEIPKLYREPSCRAYIDSVFGSADDARKAILCDFFRHAFDGSGADSFFDDCSCIDGRLTSA